MTKFFTQSQPRRNNLSLCTGEAWQDTIRASPSGYQCNYQAETATLDTGKQMNCCRNLSCYQGTLFAVLASLTFSLVRSCTQSTAPGLTDPSNGFKLPCSSTRMGQCAATWLWSEPPRGKRQKQDSTQHRNKLVTHHCT